MNLEEYKCPLCGKPLAGEEYSRAIEQLKVIAKREYSEQAEKERKELERKIAELTQNHQHEIETLKRTHEEQSKKFLDDVKASYDEQASRLKSEYEKLASESQRQFGSVIRQMKSTQKTEFQAKAKEITALKKELQVAKRLAKEEGRAETAKSVEKVRKELEEKNLQIQRANSKIEELQGQLKQSQAELKGEVGELDLYSALMKTFNDGFGDQIERQKRGTESGDIIHRIRATSGKFLETPIVYDNKESQRVSKKDLQKARKYMTLHNTSYVIIVSRNLPRGIKNRYYGEKDGVLLIHSSIIVEVARQIRNALIELARASESSEDREAKESRLYEYIRSQEFTRVVESLHRVLEDMSQLQDGEERAHQRLWKERKHLQAEVNKVYTEISSSVATILQETPAMEELAKPTPTAIHHRN